EDPPSSSPPLLTLSHMSKSLAPFDQLPSPLFRDSTEEEKEMSNLHSSDARRQFHATCISDKRCSSASSFVDDSKRRFRTNFTEAQSAILEEAFRSSHYPDQHTKRSMAIALSIPEDRVTVWFQNRRAKWRRKENREKEKKSPSSSTDSEMTRTSNPLPSIVPPIPILPDLPSIHSISSLQVPSQFQSTFPPNTYISEYFATSHEQSPFLEFSM
ncbi:hypothetical protein PMAYCL1PPCAC_30737, partial [Pristionchus mayeri]